jgi:hypothetical protein
MKSLVRILARALTILTSWFSSTPTWKCRIAPQLVHDRFHSHSLQFSICRLPFDCIGWNLRHWLSLSLSLSMALEPFRPWPLFQFLNPSHTQSVGLLGRGISPSQGRYLHTDIHSSNGIELTNPVFEREKMVHALDRAATVIGKATDSAVRYTISKYTNQRNVRYSFFYVHNKQV